MKGTVTIKMNKLSIHLKKFTCMALMAGLVFSSTATTFASEKSTSSNDEIDFELLADGVSATQQLSEEYAKLGIDLNDLLRLSYREDFNQDAIAYVNKKSLDLPVSYNESVGRTLEADRLAYAGKMAKWSMSINPKVTDINKETVYMYLSHYVDVQSPLDISNGIDNNSNMSNVWAKFIVPYDRETYDVYLAKGKARQAFTAIANSLTYFTGKRQLLKDTKDAVLGIQPVVATKTAYLTGQAGLTVVDGMNLFKTYKECYDNGKNVEETINAVKEMVSPKQGISNETIALQFVSLMLSPTPLTLDVIMMNFYIELGTNLMDRANYLSMRMYFNFRMYDRMNYKYSLGM